MLGSEKVADDVLACVPSTDKYLSKWEAVLKYFNQRIDYMYTLKFYELCSNIKVICSELKIIVSNLKRLGAIEQSYSLIPKSIFNIVDTDLKDARECLAVMLFDTLDISSRSKLVIYYNNLVSLASDVLSTKKFSEYIMFANIEVSDFERKLREEFGYLDLQSNPLSDDLAFTFRGYPILVQTWVGTQAKDNHVSIPEIIRILEDKGVPHCTID